MRKDAWGDPGGCDYCTHVLRPWGFTQGSFRSPLVPDHRGCSLAHPTPDKSAPLAHLGTATPLLPNCCGPLPAIPAFISLYNISVPSEVLLPSLLPPTSSIFLIINVILILQIPEVPQPSCESISVLSLETYLVWKEVILKTAVYFWLYIFVWKDVRDQLVGQLKPCKSSVCTGLVWFIH